MNPKTVTIGGGSLTLPVSLEAIGKPLTIGEPSVRLDVYARERSETPNLEAEKNLMEVLLGEMHRTLSENKKS